MYDSYIISVGYVHSDCDLKTIYDTERFKKWLNFKGYNPDDFLNRDSDFIKKINEYINEFGPMNFIVWDIEDKKELKVEPIIIFTPSKLLLSKIHKAAQKNGCAKYYLMNKILHKTDNILAIKGLIEF